MMLQGTFSPSPKSREGFLLTSTTCQVKDPPYLLCESLKVVPWRHGRPYRGISQCALATMANSNDKEVECILAKHEVYRQRGATQEEYLVKWNGLPQREASWVQPNEIWQFKDRIQRFHKEGSTGMSRDWRGMSCICTWMIGPKWATTQAIDP